MEAQDGLDFRRQIWQAGPRHREAVGAQRRRRPSDHSPRDTVRMTGDYYALLRRTIAETDRSPAEIRRAIYEIARHQLDKQLAALPQASPLQMRAEQNALDAAIRRIDAEAALVEPAPPKAEEAGSSSPGSAERISPSSAPKDAIAAPASPDAGAPGGRWRPGRRVRSRRLLTALKVGLAALAGGLAAGAGGYALMQSKSGAPDISFPYFSGRTAAVRPAPPPASPGVAPAPAPPSPAARREDTPGVPLPELYGVYALQEGSLSELRPVPFQSPDRRGALALISEPSRMVFRSGRMMFVMFRRSLLTSAPEHVLVSVVARVAAEIVQGAPPAPVTGQWVVRGIGAEFRVAPIKGQAEMVLIRHENINFELPPGRYALLLGEQAYDFAVDGTVTDAAQCVDRASSAAAIVYSECARRAGALVR